MRARDAVEGVLRAWNRHETGRGRAAIIDYDLHPRNIEVQPADSRLSIYAQLLRIRPQIEPDDHYLLGRVDADLAYLRALMGEREPLGAYLLATQGCHAVGWPEEYLAYRRDMARASLNDLGIGWGPDTATDLTEAEGALDIDAAADAIRDSADELEPIVRDATGATATYELEITIADEDAYWGFWLDGVGPRARLRINRRHARFSKVRARQFALHEVLGHALQGASFADRCAREDVSWVRALSVHAPHQVLLEGLAQALPLLISLDDPALEARVRLGHYLQLVCAELHILINSGTTAQDCARHARVRVPFWTDEEIVDLLPDRSSDPLLRSYLWAYAAGLDWFVSLAEAESALVREVLNAAYRDPLMPRDLAALWPAGPPVGGPGYVVRLR